MAISLQADNRNLLENAFYSYLNANNASGVSNIVVVNSNKIVANDYVLLGNFGSETAEIVKVSTVTSATHTLNLAAATKFAHGESTKVTVLIYNQIRFYRTATAVFSTTGPVTGFEDIQADDFYSKTFDSTNSTGYGWFVFYNSTTAKATANSHAIPYGGFNAQSVKDIFDDFLSTLNNKELKLVTNADLFRWINEGYSVAKTELNMSNREWNAEEAYDLATVVGTDEYTVPTDFSELISLYDDDNDTQIYAIKIKDIESWNQDEANSTRYYIRENYIGFSPTPTAVINYKVRYITKAEELTSNYDDVSLPDNNFYILKDFMMYRASPKLNRGTGKEYLDLFMGHIQRMKIKSVQRDANLDSWEIANQINI